jgi:hypothetical protein
LRYLLYGLLFFIVLASAFAAPQSDVRKRTRPTEIVGTTVNSEEAEQLTLTLTQTAVRPIQTWIRTLGTLDTSKIINIPLSPADAALIKIGQRIRVFSVSARTQMLPGRIVQVEKNTKGITVKAVLSGDLLNRDTHYLVEIIVEQGPYLSIPNGSILEEATGSVVYLQKHPGHYIPQKIEPGIRGELYTQVLNGLSEGDQVVSIGSFFIDAEYKLKMNNRSQGTGHDHHHH